MPVPSQPTNRISPPGNPYAKQLRDVSMLWHRKDKGKDLFGIERATLIALSLFVMAMPTMALRWLSGLAGLRARKIAIEFYAVFKPILLILLLWAGFSSRFWAFCIAILFVVDLYAYLLGIILLRGFWVRPASYSRSLILLAFNLVEFVAAFSVIYLHLDCLTSDKHPVTAWSDAFYFSAVTAATVGYGDITPSPGIGRLLVTVQILASIGFMAMIVAHFVGNVERERTPINDA
jgi:hypothetical protein